MNIQLLIPGLMILGSMAASAQQKVRVLRLRLDASSGVTIATDAHYPGVTWQRAQMTLELNQPVSLAPTSLRGALDAQQVYMRVFRGTVSDMLDRARYARSPNDCVMYSTARYRIDVDMNSLSMPVNAFVQKYLGDNLEEFVSLADHPKSRQSVTVVFEQEPRDGTEETSLLKLAKRDVPMYFGNAIELEITVGKQLWNAWYPPPTQQQLSQRGVWNAIRGAIAEFFAGPEAMAATLPQSNAPRPAVNEKTPIAVTGPCDHLGPSVTPATTYELENAILIPAGTLVAEQGCGQ